MDEIFANKLLKTFGAGIVSKCYNSMIPQHQVGRYIERMARNRCKTIKRANFYWRFDKLVQKGKMTDRYLPIGHDSDPIAQLFKAIYKGDK